MANEPTASKPRRGNPAVAAASVAMTPTPLAGKGEKAPSSEGATAKPKERPEAIIPSAAEPNVFLLEDLYPDPVDLFTSRVVPSADSANVMVAMDTNALLLPYTIGKDDLGALADTYRKLSAEKRLFLPARAAREFIKHRDRKLADLLKAMADERSKIAVSVSTLPPMLEELEGFQELREAATKLADGRKEYGKAQDALRRGILAWRGNDPVTALYAEVFTANTIVEHEESRDTLKAEWIVRLRDKIPPGYKDGAKPDLGIGDFLVWKALLRLGRNHKKDLIFVTGEEKADWFVRSAGDPVFGRPELLAEYRAASTGANLHLSSLADLLSQFGASTKVVSEVRSAEASANASVRFARISSPLLLQKRTSGSAIAEGEAFFDYSQSDGRVEVPSQRGGVPVRFSKASDTSIHLVRSSGVVGISRLKDVPAGAPVNLDDFDASSSSYSIHVGEAFAVLTVNAEVLIGRIVSIADDSRGASSDHVRFKYRVFPDGEGIIAP